MSDFSFLNNGIYTITGYYKNGNKEWETEYKNGKRHSKEISWYENGNKYWQQEYKDNKLHGKYMGWHENGNKDWEKYYWEDKQISEQEYLSLSNPSQNYNNKTVEIDGRKYTLKLER